MIKSFKQFLAMLLIGGFALSFSSCKDSEKVSDDPNSPENISLSKESEPAMALSRILSYTSELDSLPDNWASSSYTVEPTIGIIHDESTPYVRYVATNNKQGAIDNYNCIAETKISKDATSASWNIENVGSLAFNVLDQPDVIATLDINIKQQPHLTQIRFVPASALGLNGLTGPAYYTFGDIVALTEGDKTSYWVCARPCSNTGGKGKSHWLSFQLNDLDAKSPAKPNFIKYTKGGYPDYVLPTGLGNESESEKHLQNLIKLLAKLSLPDAFTMSNGLGELNSSEIAPAKQEAISYRWMLDKYFDKILPISQYTFNKWLTSDKEVNIFYNGKSYKGTTPHVWLAKIKINGNEAPYSVDAFTCTSGRIGWERTKEAGIDFRHYAKEGEQNPNVDQASVAALPNNGLIVRYKTGKQMIGGLIGDDTDGTKSFEEFSKNVKDVFVFNKVKERAGIAVIGDYIQNTDKSQETCVLSSTDLTEDYSCFFKLWDPTTTEKYELQPKEFSQYAYTHLLNYLILNSQEYQRYKKIKEQADLGGDDEGIDYQMPTFSESYVKGITTLYNTLDLPLKGNNIAEIVNFRAINTSGGEGISSMGNLEYFVLTFPYAKNGLYAEADLKYNVRKKTYSVVLKSSTSHKNKAFFSLKSYKDKATKLDLKRGQNFQKTLTNDDGREGIKQATMDFIKNIEYK